MHELREHAEAAEKQQYTHAEQHRPLESGGSHCTFGDLLRAILQHRQRTCARSRFMGPKMSSGGWGLGPKKYHRIANSYWVFGPSNREGSKRILLRMDGA